jgi:AcrR family transcriptional regulator
MARLEQDRIFFRSFDHAPRKGELKKYQIVLAAIDCIGEQGVQAATLEAIGKRAGISKSLVLYHFDSVDKIIGQCVRHVTATAQEITVRRVTRAADWRGRVGGYVEGGFEWAARHPNQASLMMLFYHLSAHQPEYRKLHAQIRQAGRDRLAAVLEGGFRDADKAARAARVIQGVLTADLVEFIACQPNKARWKEAKQATLARVDEMIRMYSLAPA